MIKGNIDVHCHFFNVTFAFEELLEIAWRWQHGSYPYKRDELARTASKISTPPAVQSVIEYVASFLAAAVRPPKNNHSYELECYSASNWYSSEPLLTAPLMMDIFFILDNGSSQHHKTRLQGLPADQRKTALTAFNIAKRDLPSFDAFADDLKNQVLDAFSKQVTRKGRAGVSMPEETATVADELDHVIAEFKSAISPDVALKSMPSGGTVQMTRGYKKHLEELRSLRKQNPETVFPFLAVDPRRIGIKKLVIDQVVKGSFHGVKLYCPLGYLPSHPDIYPVYKICAKNNIPITAHTSPGGMSSACDHIATSSRKKDGTIVPIVFDKKHFLANNQVGNGESAQSRFFADPDNWCDVLKSDGLGKLRVNLAHFGGQGHILAYANGSTDPKNWTGKIIRLMERFDNVFADISFCPDERMLKTIGMIMAKHPVVKNRLMFGTDFVMIMMNQCGLLHYFNRYAGIDPEMITTNPNAFLQRTQMKHPVFSLRSSSAAT